MIFKQNWAHKGPYGPIRAHMGPYMGPYGPQPGPGPNPDWAPTRPGPARPGMPRHRRRSPTSLSMRSGMALSSPFSLSSQRYTTVAPHTGRAPRRLPLAAPLLPAALAHSRASTFPRLADWIRGCAARRRGWSVRSNASSSSLEDYAVSCLGHGEKHQAIVRFSQVMQLVSGRSGIGGPWAPGISLPPWAPSRGSCGGAGA